MRMSDVISAVREIQTVYGDIDILLGALKEGSNAVDYVMRIEDIGMMDVPGDKLLKNIPIIVGYKTQIINVNKQGEIF